MMSRYQTSPATQAKRKAYKNDSGHWPVFAMKQFFKRLERLITH